MSDVEVFFDCLTLEESIVGEQVRMCDDSDYSIWLMEPCSVRERREAFFSTMGLEESSESAKFDSIAAIDDNLLSKRRRSNSEARCLVDHCGEDWFDGISIDEGSRMDGNFMPNGQCEVKEVQDFVRENERSRHENKKNVMDWWRCILQRRKKKKKKKRCSNVSEVEVMSRVRVEQNQKRCMECSAVYAGQEVKAHDGLIRTMKFSLDDQYLASGGEDGVVCVWRVSMVDASCKTDKCIYSSMDGGESNCQMKKPGYASIVIPEKIFRIEEEPLQRLHGHSGDVLDLAWSTSNYLLSASIDKTIRLWKVGSDDCLGVFHHSNYVTCVQFNPVDENYFISGCIDGKVRIWGMRSRRVQDWANARQIITTVCYQPNGKGFIVGSVNGTCYFYESSGKELLLNAEINVHSRKKSSGCRITGIQFLENDSRRVMVTSEDSKISILDGHDVVHKYKGLTKSGNQMSASFTSRGRHIVSVGDGCRIYLWNYDDLCIQAPKQSKSTRSCEHLFLDGVSVALPWSGSDTEQSHPSCSSSPSSVLMHNRQLPSSRLRDSERFSLVNWFSTDSSTRATTTWPEEKLPLWDSPSAEVDCQTSNACGDHLHQQQHDKLHGTSFGITSETWGLVFVTADHHGMIRTFHNYGLPVRVKESSMFQKKSKASQLKLCR